MGGKSIGRAIQILNEAGIPTYETPERAIRAFLYMVEYARNMEMLLEIPPKLTRNMAFDVDKARSIVARAPEAGFMSESDSREVLGAYGLPVMRTETARNEEDALNLAGKIGYPVVMKINSPDISHKTEAGGVVTDLRSEADVRSAYRGILEAARRYKPDARIAGATLQPFLSNPDYEILLGAKRDPNFGPVILFGMGGIFTEVLKDRALGLPPMNRLLARRLMQETKAYSLLKGYRNRPPADMELLEEMIVRLSQLLIDFPEIAELDMNPVSVKNGRPVAVDARILVSPAAHPSPLHLVISPYPEEYETHMTTEEGLRMFVRAVKPEDLPLFLEFLDAVSPTSLYHRFLGTIREVTPAMLARFTQIDYDREIALVALKDDSGDEQMLGVARIKGDPDGRTGQAAVLVGDPWHGMGIGSSLLRRCLTIAEARGFQTVGGAALKENRSMLALAKKLGLNVTQESASGEYRFSVELGGQGKKRDNANGSS